MLRTVGRRLLIGIVVVALSVASSSSSTMMTFEFLQSLFQEAWRGVRSIPEINCFHIANGTKFFEGDLKAPIGGVEASSSKRVSRGGIEFVTEYWKYNSTSGHYEVPVVISDAFREKDWKDIIAWSMRLIERGTNVRFVPKRSSDTDFLEIVDGMGCYSEAVGRKGGKQRVSLQINAPSGGTCVASGVVVHELMHVLGIGHEHQRPDRDEYLYIKWGNVIDGDEGQMQQQSTLDSGRCTKYDFASIMHYDMFTFAKEPRPRRVTMQPREFVGVVPLLALKHVPSSCDWRELNSIYPINGFEFTCVRHELPEFCTPKRHVTQTQCTDTFHFSCEEGCRALCNSRLCHGPSMFPQLPPHTPLGPSEVEFGRCFGENATDHTATPIREIGAAVERERLAFLSTVLSLSAFVSNV